MPPRGRRPTPTALRILHGNPQKRPLPKNEPKFTPEIPECPPELDGRAREEWDRVAPLLFEQGLLTAVDRYALAGYCTAVSDWLAAREVINKSGSLMRSQAGTFYRSPMLDIASSALKTMHTFEVEFGMTPSSRTRISAENKAKQGGVIKRNRMA